MMNKRGTGSKRKFKLEHWHIVAVLLSVYDIMAVNFSYFLALWLRFDGVFSSIIDGFFEVYNENN